MDIDVFANQDAPHCQSVDCRWSVPGSTETVFVGFLSLIWEREIDRTGLA